MPAVGSEVRANTAVVGSLAHWSSSTDVGVPMTTLGAAVARESNTLGNRRLVRAFIAVGSSAHTMLTRSQTLTTDTPRTLASARCLLR